MSLTKTLTDKLKSAPIATSLSGLSILLVNALGELVRLKETPLIIWGSKMMDMNEFVSSGIYKLDSNTINSPVGNSQGSIVLHLQWDSNAYYQLMFCYQDLTLLFRGAKTKIWRPWKRVDMTDFS